MIELTVKTLDSQNHHFSVEDDITVEQFKVHIADKVNIPADTQRIIYCGRVLQDTSKLSDYDVNGKVVHLVQRPPPSANARSNRPPSPPNTRPSTTPSFRIFDRGNTMFLGSVAFPSTFMDTQNIVPPPPFAPNLSRSRLNIARRMINRASALIRQLENVEGNGNEQALLDEIQEEEVTPVIEARVIVPDRDVLDQDLWSAMQNTLFNAAMAPNNASNSSGDNDVNESGSASSTPEGTGSPQRSSSSENLETENQSETHTLPENAVRGSELAALLTTLNQLQARFAPFMEQYQTFLAEDPVVAPGTRRQTQSFLNRVSEVMHNLGHAYHALSDIVVRVRSPRPRPLLCRPVLIQHSHVLQTGIPIQVEAQINLSSDRNTQQQSQSQSNNETGNTTQPSSTATSGASNTGSRIFVEPIRAFSRESASAPSAGDGAQNPTSAQNTTRNQASGNAPRPQVTSFSLPGNHNVEFLMEVTPEVLGGSMGGPPQEFIQNLIQMVNDQLVNYTGRNQQAQQSGNTTTSMAASETPTEQSQLPQTNTAASSSGQNSQARGNTTTNPTNSTNTRSTSRPHVRMTQQTVQGVFDPFLPCNSHHIDCRRSSRTNGGSSTSNNAQNQNNTNSGNRDDYQQALRSMISGIINQVRREHHQRQQTATPQATPPASNSSATSANVNSSSAQSARSAGSATSTTSANQNAQANLPQFASMFATLFGGNVPDLLRQGPTLDQLIQQLHQGGSYVEGENLVTDFVMVFIRNLTLVDLFTVNTGNLEPINRISSHISNFAANQICGGNSGSVGIEIGVDRLIRAMRPFIDMFKNLPVQGDIDISATIEQVFRIRLPMLLETMLNLNQSNTRQLIDQLLMTVQHILALLVNSSSNGATGVEQVFEQFMDQYMSDISNEIRTWTLMTSRAQLRRHIQNLQVPRDVLEQYIVRNQPPLVPPNARVPDIIESNSNTVQPPSDNVECMDVEEQTPVNQTAQLNEFLTPQIPMEDPEPLPTVVLGSEPWHSQVPEDWVPIITRDTQKQRRQNSQGPFSDAYLSGMPSKRRKLINNSKPQGSLPQVISESVRQAVNATGLTSAAPLETVATAAGESQEIQAAYRTLLRNSVQANLRDNEDFTPERFPNTSNYFNCPKQ